MRPLPRVHAVTDAAVLALPDLGVRAAALASAGPAVALHARDRGATGAALAAAARRLGALTRPPGASLFINGRADIAAAVGAQGLQLGGGDLSPTDARSIFSRGWIGRSVHSITEARAAITDGADFLMLGHIFDTPTHPGSIALGVEGVQAVAALGVPVIAIGGITPERAAEVRRAGAWGVAAIRALWLDGDPASAAQRMLQALEEAA